MGSPPGDHAGANAGAARAMQLKVLMPSSSRKMTSSRRTYWAARALAATAARLPRRAFGKVWDVEVGRDDGDGSAFLGRGWPEFAAAHGLGVGWFVVLRHEGGGVVTVKVLDTTNCLKEFATPPAVVATRRGRARDASHKPQFVRVLLPGFMEKMRIPDKFVQHHITEEHLNSNMANILSPLGKFWRIELEKDDSGMFFKGIFCKSIGLVDESTITLETSRGSSRRSWEVPAHVKKNGHGGCYLVGAGWKRFCHDNGLKVGDVCTFNVVEANLWHKLV
ncbi:hypothetical protein E2562_027302 [Oryza meyeriana var. granulata]|uniref:TF-B3 domain-containing protein n=1 Tax=Oryza meyeriana var. granulata TaxID=110450 RepID=A0A6G1C0B9_9ORYZ|nr:hypothetical protein E2562_027302 [Oryza meyeriana var. granulata]